MSIAQNIEHLLITAERPSASMAAKTIASLPLVVVDTIKATGYGILATLTLEASNRLHEYEDDSHENAFNRVELLLAIALKTLNPNWIYSVEHDISRLEDILENIQNKILSAQESNSVIKKHVYARILAVEHGAIGLASLIALTALGAIAAALATITLGRVDTLNKYTILYLPLATAIIPAALLIIRGIINPQALA